MFWTGRKADTLSPDYGMQKWGMRWGVVFGLVGLALIAIGGVSCKRKEYSAPTVGVAGGDTFLGGGEARSIRLWAQIQNSQGTPGEAATVKIIARVTNALGRPMPDETSVTWLATVGTLDAVTTTTTDGIASVTLTFPKNFTSCSTVTAISGQARRSIRACAEVLSSNITIRADDTDVDWNEHVWVTVQLKTDGKADVGFQVTFTVTQEPTSPPIVAVDNESVVVTDAKGNAAIRLDIQNTTDEIVLITVKARAADGREAEIQILVRAHP